MNVGNACTKINLRIFDPSDQRVLVEYLNNTSVTQYLTSAIPQPYTLADAKWWIETGSQEGIMRAIEYDGVLVGSIGAKPGIFERARSAEIGYWLAEPYWGKGIATAALTELSQLIFDTTDIVRLFATVFPQNKSSTKVLEKVGYEHECLLKKSVYKNGAYFDTYLYALIKR
jgi:RimJ/RimL family protein N-acetyltransferase